MAKRGGTSARGKGGIAYRGKLRRWQRRRRWLALAVAAFALVVFATQRLGRAQWKAAYVEQLLVTPEQVEALLAEPPAVVLSEDAAVAAVAQRVAESSERIAALLATPEEEFGATRSIGSGSLRAESLPPEVAGTEELRTEPLPVPEVPEVEQLRRALERPLL